MECVKHLLGRIKPTMEERLRENQSWIQRGKIYSGSNFCAATGGGGEVRARTTSLQCIHGCGESVRLSLEGRNLVDRKVPRCAK